jgi:DNA-binding NarL/FixJ family response regulator
VRTYIASLGSSAALLIFRNERANAVTAPAWGARATLLLLEPQPLYRAALTSLLSNGEIAAEVFPASSLAECVERLVEATVDLVIAAITPELSPLRVLMAVREARDAVPVLFLGESNDVQSRINALRAGAVGALTRDASPAAFIAAIDAALRGRRSMDDALADRLLSSATDIQRSLSLAALSTTEREILGMLGVAWSTRAIADARGITPKAVRNHVTNIYRKLGVSSRPEAVRYAARMGFGPDREERAQP